jgi:hypothetical protein
MSVKGKMISVETVPGIRADKNKGGWWRGEFKHDIFDIL